MKIFTVFLLFVIFISFANAQEKRPSLKKVEIAADTTLYLNDLTQEKIKKIKVDNIMVIEDDSVQFKANGETVPLLIIIPKADLLFSNYSALKSKDYNTVYTINGITFLFIYLDETNRESDLLFINYHDPKKENDKYYYYRYSVYIIDENIMAEGKSSPEIIVDP